MTTPTLLLLAYPHQEIHADWSTADAWATGIAVAVALCLMGAHLVSLVLRGGGRGRGRHGGGSGRLA